jgi:hypothetical protein
MSVLMICVFAITLIFKYLLVRFIDGAIDD